ncbi:hypothetical protein NDU88_005491 [Pleurodeles waltl]|uniref:Uncharacterized protein n=1 Tax=Pleurodeles waltl TaxID=8319 RepID=A0AAV7SLV8_PLEWA|nr:hypothetical protein NDU88_005491 [Pleurodeles waltl]
MDHVSLEMEPHVIRTCRLKSASLPFCSEHSSQGLVWETTNHLTEYFVVERRCCSCQPEDREGKVPLRVRCPCVRKHRQRGLNGSRVVDA